MMIVPKRIGRFSSLSLVGILIVSVVGCGGGGDGGDIFSPPALSTYAGASYTAIRGLSCAAVAAIVPGHRSIQTAESAARQLCQGEASRLAAQVGGTILGCQTVWTNECVAYYGGISGRNCSVSGARGNSASTARSNALRDCRNSLGSGADCEIITAGCASSASPLTGVWRPSSGSTQPPPQQPPSQQPPFTGSSRPIQNFNVTLSSSCFQQVQICVSDHQCEDGDAIQVTVNGGTVFSGELFNREQCRIVPVRTGTNSIQLFALNGTGFKGNCSHADANTGRIRVIGSNTVIQNWEHRGGAGSSANLNISVGPPGGSCP